MKPIEELIQQVRAERALDARTAVFEVQAEPRGAGVALVGETTESDVADELVERARALLGRRRVRDEVRRLPDPVPSDALCGVVRASLAPVLDKPGAPALQISQYVLGHRLDLLSHRGSWWRVRGEDGYIGWVHFGYLEVGEWEWARIWERGEEGEAVVSLGAELVDDEERVIMPLPWGARLIRESPGRFRIPDGRHGLLIGGEVVAADRMRDRFPLLGESVTRTARRWLGTPYLWGGVTRAAADCSGFVQSVYWMHGIALPRDSDLQARGGAQVEIGADFSGLRAGDLLFFVGGLPGEHELADSRPGGVTHVAISLGGSNLIHSSMSNGGVDVNDLTGDLPAERRLRTLLAHARRFLPD